MKALVIIPARGGSKGIPGKNIKLLNGKPLITYTIDSAREIFEDSQICVSTDSLEILRVVEDLGLNVPFVRPLHLSTDESSSVDVIIHAVDEYVSRGFSIDIVVLLQPTSPFRSSDQVLKAMELMDEDCDAVISVKLTKSNPYSVLFEENSRGWLEKAKPGNFTRRQDYPLVWELNGAIYCFRISSLMRSKSLNGLNLKKYVMDEKSSLDIDTPIDWFFAEHLMREQKNL